MSIQGNINQIISLSALLATQSPGLRAQGEKKAALSANQRALETAEEGIATARYAQESNAAKNPEERTRPEPIAPLYKQRTELLEERFKLDPSMENWEELHKSRGMTKLFEAIDPVKQEMWDKEVQKSFDDMRAQIDARNSQKASNSSSIAQEPEAEVSPIGKKQSATEARFNAQASLIAAQKARRQTRQGFGGPMM